MKSPLLEIIVLLMFGFLLGLALHIGLTERKEKDR